MLLAIAQHHSFTFNIDLYAFYIPLALILGTPWLLVRFVLGLITRRPSLRQLPFFKHYWLEFLAGVAWFWSVQLPNLPLAPSVTQSTTIHFIGGAVVAPALYFYLARAFEFAPDKAVVRFIGLFSAVLVFGLLNEVAEQILNHEAGAHITTSDTWWDLGTNTVGMIVAFAATELWRRRKTAASE